MYTASSIYILTQCANKRKRQSEQTRLPKHKQIFLSILWFFQCHSFGPCHSVSDGTSWLLLVTPDPRLNVLRFASITATTATQGYPTTLCAQPHHRTCAPATVYQSKHAGTGDLAISQVYITLHGPTNAGIRHTRPCSTTGTSVHF